MEQATTLGIPPSPFLYPILDDSFSANLVQDARDALRAGVQILQLRAKKLSKRLVYDTVEDLYPIFREANATLIVNDYVDIAIVSHASGVHLGQDDFPADEARKVLVDKLIGLSTHNREQVVVANHVSVDYIAIGPVYQTDTKGNSSPALGLQGLQIMRRQSNHPVVCIGGIHLEHIPDLLSAGVDGIAVISQLYKNGDIYENIKNFISEISKVNQRKPNPE
jgi:thiamine-phosphate pyrophosphorylase